MHITFCSENLKQRPRHRREDIIELDITEIGQQGMNWIKMAQDRVQSQVLMNMVIKLQVPCKVN